MAGLNRLKKRHFGLVLFALLAVIITCLKYDQRVKRARYRELFTSIKCSRLLHGDTREQARALPLVTHYRYHGEQPSEGAFIELTSNCSSFISSRKYLPRKVTQEERDFSIAYAILVYKDIDLAERLLRAIYRPQNYYCIHVDSKSSAIFRKAIESIAVCFNNVFLSSVSYHVKWASKTVLSAEIQCMEDLRKYRKWRYYINLTGQEFPLKTNLELVKILRAFNGTNDIHSDVQLAQKNVNWTSYSWEHFHKQLPHPKSPPPSGIRLAKGEAHVVVSREFVHYVTSSATAKQFLEWIGDTRVPDEYYFQSLNINSHLGVPGSHNGNYGTHSVARYKHWVYDRKRACGGTVARGICIFGIRDLPGLSRAPQLFANKFSLRGEAITYRCMEEWLDNKEQDKLMRLKVGFYRQLPFVKASRNRS